MRSLLEMTNAVKAQIIVVVNAVLALLGAFGVNLSDKQQAATMVLVNAVMALWVALTYQYSHKRRNHHT